MMLALIEHLMSWYSFLTDRVKQAIECDWKIGSWFYYLTTVHLSHIYKCIPVSIFSVLWAEYVNISMTFTWTFVDLFIMIISIAISTKFKMINERLEHFKGRVGAMFKLLNLSTNHFNIMFQIVNEAFWDEIRCHYNKLCELNELVDDALGFMICTACLSDLYYVCLQLLNVAT